MEYKEGIIYKLKIRSDVSSKVHLHLARSVVQPFVYYPNGKQSIKMDTDSLIIKNGDTLAKNTHMEVENIGDREAIIELNLSKEMWSVLWKLSIGKLM
jgi:hypothetical protein